MPFFVIPDSNGEDVATPVREHNTCHEPGGKSTGGQFCGDGVATPPVAKLRRPPVIRVTDIDEALALLSQGEVVELANVSAVNTLLEKMAAMVLDAMSHGKDIPNYDLCKVSVAGTNLFCAARVRNKNHPEGIARVEMPQFAGYPVKGSPADKLPVDKNGNVDGGPAFIEWLKVRGIKVTAKTMSAAKLRATQAQLIGANVVGILKKGGGRYDPKEEGIFTSSDSYVIDGHHRWAARVGRDTLDGHLGDVKIRVREIDAPVSWLLALGNRFTKEFGIQSQGQVVKVMR